MLTLWMVQTITTAEARFIKIEVAAYRNGSATKPPTQKLLLKEAARYGHALRPRV